MVASMSLSLVVVLSLAAAISVVDADSSMIQNLRSAYYQTTTATSTAETAPSIRILQDGDGDQNGQGQDNVPNLSPVIVEYWAIEGDGYGKPLDEDVPDVPTDPEEKVAEDLSLSVATTTTPEARNLSDSEESQAEANNANDKDNDNEIIKSRNKNSMKDDTKWVILVAVLGGASLLLMIIMLILVCRALRHNRFEFSIKEAEGENTTAATAAETAAKYDASCDPTETDLDFPEHPDILEIYTDSASEASFC
jgi:hypothetical protein